MFQNRGQVLFGIALLCQLLAASANQLCFDSGVDVQGDAARLMPIVNVKDHDLLNLAHCPNESCFECIREEAGSMMLYAATCAREIPDEDGMICTKTGAFCSTASDLEKCGKQILEIRNMTVCRFSTAVNYIIHDGGYDVYCKDSCATAAFIYDEMWYLCRGCSGFCELWLQKKKTSYPTGDAKFCPGLAECEIEGKANPHERPQAADMASDDGGGAGGLSHSSAVLIPALAAASAALCLGLAL